MKAAKRGHVAAMEVLLARGADVHAKCNSGETALIKAKRREHTEAVQLLLKHGAADLDVPPPRTDFSIPGYSLKPIPDAARPETMYLVEVYRKEREEQERKQAEEDRRKAAGVRVAAGMA